MWHRPICQMHVISRSLHFLDRTVANFKLQMPQTLAKTLLTLTRTNSAASCERALKMEVKVQYASLDIVRH